MKEATRRLACSLLLCAFGAVGACECRKAKITARNRAALSADASPLEGELTRRLSLEEKWEKTEEGYSYGDLTVSRVYDRWSSWIALKWKDHSLWRLLERDAEIRVKDKAARLYDSLREKDRQREKVERRKRADVEAEKLKRQP